MTALVAHGALDTTRLVVSDVLGWLVSKMRPCRVHATKLRPVAALRTINARRKEGSANPWQEGCEVTLVANGDRPDEFVVSVTLPGDCPVPVSDFDCLWDRLCAHVKPLVLTTSRCKSVGHLVVCGRYSGKCDPMKARAEVEKELEPKYSADTRPWTEAWMTALTDEHERRSREVGTTGLCSRVRQFLAAMAGSPLFVGWGPIVPCRFAVVTCATEGAVKSPMTERVRRVVESGRKEPLRKISVTVELKGSLAIVDVTNVPSFGREDAERVKKQVTRSDLMTITHCLDDKTLRAKITHEHIPGVSSSAKKRGVLHISKPSTQSARSTAVASAALDEDDAYNSDEDDSLM